jgi:hypothetical protein
MPMSRRPGGDRELGIDRKIIRSDRGPCRYTDDRGAATWKRTMAMLNGN